MKNLVLSNQTKMRSIWDNSKETYMKTN